MTKNLTVNGTSSFKNTTITGTFGVTENSSFDKNLSVGDNLTVSENFFIIGGGLRFTDSGNVPDYTIDCFAKTDLVCQHIPEGYKSVYAQFSILFKNNEIRNHVQYTLSEKKIPSVV